MSNSDYCTVNLLVGGKTIKAKVEKGITIEDNNGLFIVDGDNKTLKLPNYRYKALEAVSKGDEEAGLDGFVLSKKDIEAAKTKVKDKTFRDYLSKFLPFMYKSSNEKTSGDALEFFVSDGGTSKSNIKLSSKKLPQKTETTPSKASSVQRPSADVVKNTKNEHKVYKVTTIDKFSQQEKETKYCGANFGKPLEGDLTITSNFKKNRVIPGRTPRDHKGWDLRATVGTPVKAAYDGTVTVAQGGIKGYGNAIYIDHGMINDKHVISEYGHLSDIQVKSGQKIKKGENIGLSGGKKDAPGSGISKAPHLHFTIREFEGKKRIAVPPNKYIPTDIN